MLSSLFLLTTSIFIAEAATKDADYYLKKASAAYNQKDYPRAEKAFRELLMMKVSLHADFYYFYGKTLYYNGKYKI